MVTVGLLGHRVGGYRENQFFYDMFVRDSVRMEVNMKKILIAFVSIMLLLSGCHKNKTVDYDYSFSGENEKWTVTYEAKGGSSSLYGMIVNEAVTLTYKGDISELSSMRNINYNYKSFGLIGGSIGFGRPTDRKTFKIEKYYEGNQTEIQFDTVEFQLKVDANDPVTIVLK